MAVGTAGKQRGRQFRKGQSGNPAGRPKGSMNKATRLAQSLLDGEAAELTRKVIELAKGGDMQALRLCLDRLVPPKKDSPVRVAMPDVNGAAGMKQASEAILMAVATGEITPAEGHAIAAIVEGHRKVIELAEIERRIAALEQRHGITK